MDSSPLCNPKMVDQFRQVAKREGIAHQMEILPASGTDADGVPSIALSIPCRYVHIPNKTANGSNVRACIDLLARYLKEAHTGDYAL